MNGGVGRRLTRALATEEGATAIEFALTFPVVLALMFGILDVGRLTLSQAALDYAAGEATRYAIVREGQVTNSDIQTYAEQTLIDSFGLGTAAFQVDTAPDPVTGTSVITVVGSYNFSFMLPFLPANMIRLTAESRGFLAFPSGYTEPAGS